MNSWCQIWSLAPYVNVQLPEKAAEDSISFYPLLKHPEASGERYRLIHHAYDGMYAVRKGDWKYVEGLGSGGFSEPRRYSAAKGEAGGQLYHIADDSPETLNLCLTRQEKVEELKTILKSSAVSDTFTPAPTASQKS